jgi:N-carbamoyl-L-amino-acid hydrolase
MVSINSERLMNDLRRVAEFGSYKTGVHRPTFSPQDIEARNWLSQSMRDANLDASIDGVGNVVGKCETKGPVLLVGSHAESECYAGWLDGILGVVYAIELARAFHESSDCSGFGIDVGVWADEECHFLQFLGSRSFVGDLDEREIDAAFSKNDGTSLRDALRIAGYAGRAREKIDPTRYVGYLEAHIEQGDYLDGAGLPLPI